MEQLYYIIISRNSEEFEHMAQINLVFLEVSFFKTG